MTISAQFKKPFKEQVAAMEVRTKNLIPTQKWDDIKRNAHDRGFMVAGAMKADLLADFAGSIERAIKEGKSLDAFRKEFDEIVDKHGWAYKGERNWRTRVIFTTNMRTTYAAGRLSQLKDPELQKVAPYWMYKHGGSQDPREDHLELDGMVVLATDDFWLIYYPPNDFGCSCYVIAVSKAAAERLGGRFVEPPKNKAGIGKGWDYQPGQDVQAEIRNLVNTKAEALPQQLAAALLNSEAQQKIFAQWFEKPSKSWPLVKVSADDAKLIKSKATVASLSADTVKKQKRSHAELGVKDYAQAQQAVLNYTHKVKDGANIIYVQAVDGYVLVVKTTSTGKGLFVTSIRKLSSADAKKDKEINRLISKGK